MVAGETLDMADTIHDGRRGCHCKHTSLLHLGSNLKPEVSRSVSQSLVKHKESEFVNLLVVFFLFWGTLSMLDWQ